MYQEEVGEKDDSRRGQHIGKHVWKVNSYICIELKCHKKILTLKTILTLCSFSLFQHVCFSRKKNKKKGKTISLTDSLAGDVGTGGGNTHVSQPDICADKTDNLERNVSITWHSNDGSVYRAPPTHHPILPTAPQAA